MVKRMQILRKTIRFESYKAEVLKSVNYFKYQVINSFNVLLQETCRFNS